MNIIGTDDPEIFWTAVSAIGTVVAAVGTVGAVLTSLYLAHAERRASLKVHVTLDESAMENDKSDAENILQFRVKVTNIGLRECEVRVGYFYCGWWRYILNWGWLRYLPHAIAIDKAIALDSVIQDGVEVIESGREAILDTLASDISQELERENPFRKAPILALVYITGQRKPAFVHLSGKDKVARFLRSDTSSR